MLLGTFAVRQPCACVTQPGAAHLGQTPDLLTYPPDPIRHRFKAINDCCEERVGDLHQHGDSRLDDGFDVGVARCDLGRDAAGERRWKSARIVLDLLDHLLVHLTSARAAYSGVCAHLERVDLEVEVFMLYKTVDPLCQDSLQVRLTRSSTGVRRHHP